MTKSKTETRNTQVFNKDTLDKLFKLENAVLDIIGYTIKSMEFINDGYANNDTLLNMIMEMKSDIESITDYARGCAKAIGKELIPELPLYLRVLCLRKMVADIRDLYRFSYIYSNRYEELTEEEDLVHIDLLIALKDLEDAIGDCLMCKHPKENYGNKH